MDIYWWIFTGRHLIKEGERTFEQEDYLCYRGNASVGYKTTVLIGISCTIMKRILVGIPAIRNESLVIIPDLV